jgi:hypothetical protein
MKCFVCYGPRHAADREQAQIDCLEKRVYQLERKNWERTDFTFRVIIHCFTAAIALLVIVSIVLSASHPGR